MKHNVDVVRIRENSIQLNGWVIGKTPDSVPEFAVLDAKGRPVEFRYVSTRRDDVSQIYYGKTYDLDFGFDIQNHMKRQLLSMNYGNLSTNRGVEILNAWTPTNTDTDIPALSLTDDNNESRFSSYYVENGSYMKMKYLKLSYALPKNLIKKIGASNLEVYGQVENVFTLTSYTGLDPEILPGEYGARIDNGAYPRPRTFTVGVNFQF